LSHSLLHYIIEKRLPATQKFKKTADLETPGDYATGRDFGPRPTFNLTEKPEAAQTGWRNARFT